VPAAVCRPVPAVIPGALPAVLLAVLVAVTACSASPAPLRSQSGVVEKSVAGVPREARAVRVLRAWGRLRAQAWATGSVPALRRLYVGSAGSEDVRRLAAYAARDLRVRQMTVQVLAAHVLVVTPDRLRVAVTDRLAHAEAVGRDGSLVEVLPRAMARQRVVTLLRVGGEWRVAAVSPGRE